ncbi:unnamed protein product, partial [Brassica rapa subsp. narinosa]
SNKRLVKSLLLRRSFSHRDLLQLPHTGEKKKKSFQRMRLFWQRRITKIKKRHGREQSIKLLH